MRTYYSLSEAAKLLGCSRGAVSRAVRSGRLPAVRLSRIVRIPRAALEPQRREDLPPAGQEVKP